MRRIVGVLLLVAVALAVVEAGGGHDYYHRDDGWFESLGNRLSEWMPWNSKLGSDWSETHHRVENIYQQWHDDAQRRVEELKEESLRSAPEVQKRIADIYAEAASRAERDIESLKHPMMEWLSVWRHHAPDSSTSTLENASRAAKGIYDKGADYASRVKEDIESLPKKLHSGYQSALDQARSSIESEKPSSWDEAKNRAAQLYSDAFHKGHGSTRTTLGTLRDTIGRGMSGTARVAGKVVSTTWSLMLQSMLAAFWAILGGALTWMGLNFLNKRRFKKQLNSFVSGPIVAVGQYVVLGDEARQRKFYEYWSGPAQAYFTRQPGLRKHWMHRGVRGGENVWLCYSEWESIDALRRAHDNPEFFDVKKRAPKPQCEQMILYQLDRVDDQSVDKSKEAVSGLRQRASTTTPAT